MTSSFLGVTIFDAKRIKLRNPTLNPNPHCFYLNEITFWLFKNIMEPLKPKWKIFIPFLEQFLLVNKRYSLKNLQAG